MEFLTYSATPSTFLLNIGLQSFSLGGGSIRQWLAKPVFLNPSGWLAGDGRRGNLCQKAEISEPKTEVGGRLYIATRLPVFRLGRLNILQIRVRTLHCHKL